MEPTRKDSFSSSDTDSESASSDRSPLDIFVEEGELSDDQDVTLTDPDQSLSGEQTYRETMMEIRLYMGWTHIPDMDTNTINADDNPFAVHRYRHQEGLGTDAQTTGYVRKISKRNHFGWGLPQLATLFPDSVIKKAEEDISSFESKGRSRSDYRKGRYHPCERSEKKSDSRRFDDPAWKNPSTHGQGKRNKGKSSYCSSRLANTQ